MEAIIRKIEERDISGFYEALCSVAKEGVYLLTTTPPAYEKMENFVRNNINNNNAQYVALINNRVIGWADLIPLERNTMNHVGHLGMGVLLGFRGMGIGSRLLEKVVQHAWDQGLTRLELEVFTDNDIAIKLYQKNNFEIEGVKKYARLFAGKYQHITMMAICTTKSTTAKLDRVSKCNISIT